MHWMLHSIIHIKISESDHMLMQELNIKQKGQYLQKECYCIKEQERCLTKLQELKTLIQLHLLLLYIFIQIS